MLRFSSVNTPAARSAELSFFGRGTLLSRARIKALIQPEAVFFMIPGTEPAISTARASSRQLVEHRMIIRWLIWEPVRVMAGIAMGLKCPVCAAEDRADS